MKPFLAFLGVALSVSFGWVLAYSAQFGIHIDKTTIIVFFVSYVFMVVIVCINEFFFETDQKSDPLTYIADNGETLAYIVMEECEPATLHS